ncbi:DUF305 domain-containing protein [Micromonospora sp. NPDC049679]|uniref:DUF305 domain-containing protein n=1 Tax=Micromonospora sp. NPDC049679 TaxID=3155920 RepID=UPI003400AA9E
MQSIRSINGRARVALVTAAALLLLPAACGDETSHDGRPGPVTDHFDQESRHNDADIAFLQGMIPHHRQAVEMAALAESRARNADVKMLAEQIKLVQAAEITQLNAWLTEWNAPVPSPAAAVHGQHDTVPGMATEQKLADLENAEGAEFDRAFLEMMIGHHEGARQMAVTEQREGQHPGVRELATRIEKAQGNEIEQMRRTQAN